MTRKQAKNAFRRHAPEQGFRVRARRIRGRCQIRVTDRRARATLVLGSGATWLDAYRRAVVEVYRP